MVVLTVNTTNVKQITEQRSRIAMVTPQVLRPAVHEEDRRPTLDRPLACLLDQAGQKYLSAENPGDAQAQHWPAAYSPMIEVCSAI
jgi:hypothetical protein